MPVIVILPAVVAPDAGCIAAPTYTPPSYDVAVGLAVEPLMVNEVPLLKFIDPKILVPHCPPPPTDVFLPFSVNEPVKILTVPYCKIPSSLELEPFNVTAPFVDTVAAVPMRNPRVFA